MATAQLARSAVLSVDLGVGRLQLDGNTPNVLLADTDILDTQFNGITQNHWKGNTDHPNCMNPSCRKKFTLTERNHHCRRCGGVFCTTCCGYRRRLNQLAHPDPSSKFYKVCRRCFEDPQTIGQTRSLMADFQNTKMARLQQHRFSQIDIGAPHKRSSMEVSSECARLTCGFSKSIGTSAWKKAGHDLKAFVSQPEWQLPVNIVYERLVPYCRFCHRNFTLWTKRHNCTVCGAATCSSCSMRELIVYIPDDQDPENKDARWAVIKIVGCPESEPDICVYLRVCKSCHTTLTDIQVTQHYSQQDNIDDIDGTDVWSDINHVHVKFTDILNKIENQLPKYKTLIEALEITHGSPLSLPSGRSNTQILAKAQGDLSNHFTQLVLVIQSVKTIKPTTNGQSNLLHNIIKSKCCYYQENIFLFRELRRKLEVITPLEFLQVIQDIVDSNAINSCYLTIKQVALEVLHLTTKCHLEDDLAVALAQLEEVVLKELKASVAHSGENWDDHERCMNQLLQLQLKHHRLLCGSRRLREQREPCTVQEVMGNRIDSVLRQVALQLSDKCADRSFPRTKAALCEAQRALDEASRNPGQG